MRNDVEAETAADAAQRNPGPASARRLRPQRRTDGPVLLDLLHQYSDRVLGAHGRVVVPLCATCVCGQC